VSILTKVFIVLLTVFSIFLSALVVASFAHQQNWKASAEDWRQAALAAQSKERAAVGTAVIDKQRSLDQHQRDRAKISDLQDKIAERESRLSDLERSLAEAQNRLAAEQAQVTSATESARLLQVALSTEKEFSSKLAHRNSELERANIDLTDRVKELTMNVETARIQVRALKEQIASMDESARAGGGLPAVATQIPGSGVEPGVPSVEPQTAPPAVVPIRGEVVGVQANLASISVGSADGVSPGMTFLVYRRQGGGKPQYLGSIKINKVAANEAVGLIEQAQGDIQIGDTVRDEASFAMRG
jgi:hypothetical protein